MIEFGFDEFGFYVKLDGKKIDDPRRSELLDIRKKMTKHEIALRQLESEMRSICRKIESESGINVLKAEKYER